MTPDKLPKEIADKIKSDASAYSDISRFIAYTQGATAWARWKVKHDELQAQAQRMADALESISNSPAPANEKEMVSWILTARALAVEQLQQFKDGKGKDEFTGSTFTAPAPGITLGCISPEARELLDTIMEEWEKHYKDLKEVAGYKEEPTFYGFAYWLVRWSGLIQPAITNPQK